VLAKDCSYQTGSEIVYLSKYLARRQNLPRPLQFRIYTPYTNVAIRTRSWLRQLPLRLQLQQLLPRRSGLRPAAQLAPPTGGCGTGGLAAPSRPPRSSPHPAH
jgi:hypothetical protein